MAKKQVASVPASRPEAPLEQEPGPENIPGVQRGSSLPQPTKDKPIHEIRIGRVKAVIWANHTEQGLRHNVTLRRLFKRDTNPQWEQSDSFGRDDLPRVVEVARTVWLWIYVHGQG